MSKSREEILAFYEDFRREDGWGRLEAMCVFLPRLFRERPLDGCTFFTSHATLCISRSATYPEWFKTPTLMIHCTTKERLQLDLRRFTSAEPVVRSVTESSSCPIDLGLGEFDRLYEMFLSAHP